MNIPKQNFLGKECGSRMLGWQQIQRERDRQTERLEFKHILSE